jgi:hypothetical protein
MTSSWPSPGDCGRLRRLEDERAILRTLSTYGHGIDYGLEDEFVDCWVPDGVLEWPAPHLPYVGRDAIRETFRRHTHAPQRFHKHVVVAPVIELEGDRATVQSYFARLDDFSGGPGITGFGRYVDALVRCEDGRWRFQVRRTELEAARPARPY